MGPGAAMAAQEGVQAVGNVWSSKIAAKSAKDSANIQARSVENSTRIRNQFDEKQLKYLQGESSLTRQQDEINRWANFGQWDTDASNLYNRNRDALLNTYGATNAQGVNTTDRFNVGQGNIYDQWTTGRGDTNLQLARTDQRMSDLGAMLGIDRRSALEFEDDPALRQATFTPGPKPVITDRERTKYVTGVPLTDKSRV